MKSKTKKAAAAPPPAVEAGAPTEEQKADLAGDANISDNLKLLLKGAGVEAKDVIWRIRAGLTEKQAVDVAAAEKAEAEKAAADKKAKA